MGPAKATKKEQMRLNIFSKLAANKKNNNNNKNIYIYIDIGNIIFTLEIFLSIFFSVYL